MPWSPDYGTKNVVANENFFGMNGVASKAKDIFHYVGMSESYPLQGFVFALTSGILTVEQFVDKYVLIHNKEYQQIIAHSHHTDSHDDTILQGRALRQKRAELIAESQALYQNIQGGLLVLLYDQYIVLSAFQLKSVTAIEPQVMEIHEPIDQRKVSATPKGFS